MAPTNPMTHHKPETTKVGEAVLDLVIPYIHDIDDRNSLSLVSRKSYEVDGITRKRVTVHTLYYPNPVSLCKRFPFIKSLTLKGIPTVFYYSVNYDSIRITPWIEQLALEFRCLKELHIAGLAVYDEDLETLARTRGKDLSMLKIKMCQRFSTDGLMHISKYCNQLTTLCLRYSFPDNTRDDRTWLHQLALNNMVLERLHVTNMNISEEDLTLLAKNCCNSLISLKIGECYLSKLGDAFKYAVSLEHFAGDICDSMSELVGFEFPPNIRSLSTTGLPITYSSVLHLLNQIRRLRLVFVGLDEDHQCLLFKRCPNLEVLYTVDVCRDTGLQVIGKFCKKLRKLTHDGVVTHVGLISLAKGCTNLESLDVMVKDISNEALECIGTHLKNVRHFRIWVGKKNGKTNLPLDNGFRAMLIGCSKLARLDIILRHGGLTDVGLEYIEKYGVNLRSLDLECVGNSYAGLVKLSQGCQKLKEIKLIGCPFNEQVVRSLFNIQSLRYVWGKSSDGTALARTRPEFQQTLEGARQGSLQRTSDEV